MNEISYTEWYIHTDEGAEGPFSPGELIQQACIGHIVGDSELSANPDGPWLKAESLDALEMEWQVRPEDAPALPRCHVMALRNWVETEKVQPYWDIHHVPSGEVYNVVDALCSALLAQNHLLEGRLVKQGHAPSGHVNEAASGQGLRVETDHAKKEASKWKRLYDDEIQRNESREQELLQDNESLRDWQRKASERIKALERRQATTNESRQLAVNDVDASSGDRDLASAYEELKLQMTHLLDSLQLKSRQLDEAREQIRELKSSIRSERKNAEEKVDRVSGLHEDTLDQLNRIEQAHMHLTKSFRDLNDRLIQSRNQQPASPSPKKDVPSPPSDAGQEIASPTPQKKPDGSVKIKMT